MTKYISYNNNQCSEDKLRNFIPPIKCKKVYHTRSHKLSRIIKNI